MPSEDDFPDLNRQYGTDPGETGFNAISREYKANPTIENYVRLRREHPDGELEIAITGGIEFLFHSEQELLSYGISQSTFTEVLDVDLESQAKLSLQLLELLIERKEKERSGATHLVSRKEVISDTLVNYLIASALDSMSWSDEMEISRELIVLIKHQLGSISSTYEVELDKREKKHQARMIAAQIAAKGKIPTYRQIGRAMGVQASTVMRWFAGEPFISDAKTLAEDIQKLQLIEEIRAMRPNKD